MQTRRWMAHSVISVCLASASAVAHAKPTAPRGGAGKQVGLASYYSDRFHGRRTANGERYDKNQLTADHPHLPFGTVVRVVNLSNQRSVEVRVNDRTRLPKGRILDLSKRAARELGMVNRGVARIALEVLSSKGDS
ncbi:septal ring lytic transglycosylase RlpA family protein [Methyloterricola oryzae]|uniref:septal ring lytic transglycosylase RlpA family protein n=1 Tax=Methyloterricola oryzae TaxID=1495050 RepID=UPI0005EAD605|nr:septal ring lytic transglycosylase RlpA family protein [Methyloterricola oryzae]